MILEKLPIPLSPFEHYFLADDRPDYPMTFWVYLGFTGNFNHEYFKAALKEAIKIHPRFRATIPGTPGDKMLNLKWVAASSTEPYLNWDQESAPLFFPKGLRINLQEELGIRVFIREGPQQTKLYFQVHHACCDALGIVQFLTDFFRFYDEMVSSLEEGAAFKSFQRANLSVPLIKESLWKKIFWSVPKDFYTVINFFLRPIQPLGIPGPPKSKSEDLLPAPHFQSFSFNSEETRHLIQMAARHSATLNDLMLRDLFLALREWNRLYHSKNLKGCIRVLQPVILRTSVNGSSHVRNEFSMVNLDVSPRHFASRKNLFKHILKMTKKNKNLDGTTALMPKFFQKIGSVKGGMPWLLKEKRLFTSTLFSLIPFDSLLAFSNIPLDDGRMVFGKMRLDHIIGFPPVRKTTPAVFGATLYAKNLIVIIHYDPRTYTDSQAKELLERFVTQLRISMNSTD